MLNVTVQTIRWSMELHYEGDQKARVREISPNPFHLEIPVTPEEADALLLCALATHRGLDIARDTCQIFLDWVMTHAPEVETSQIHAYVLNQHGLHNDVPGELQSWRVPEHPPTTKVT